MGKSKKNARKLRKINEHLAAKIQNGAPQGRMSQPPKQSTTLNQIKYKNKSSERTVSSTSGTYNETFAANFLNKSHNHYKRIHVSNLSSFGIEQGVRQKPVTLKQNKDNVNIAPGSSDFGQEISDAEENQCENNSPYKKRRVVPNNTTGNITIIDEYVEEIISDIDETQEGSLSEIDPDIQHNFLKYNTYDIDQENEDAFRITLYKDTFLYIHGLISVRVLQGSVEILGYKLNASDETFNVYSPGGSSLLYISNCTDSNNIDTAVVRCEKLDTPLSRSLCCYAPKNIFPPIQGNGTQCIVKNAEFFQKQLLLETPPQWEEFANTLTADSRVVIAGSKGTGKSTLLRYLVNQLLSKDQMKSDQSCVLVIDLDPGQPEFTPPGCISIVLVKSPLFGPSYTHQQIPEKCVHISHIDIKYNMDEYIRSCKYLLTLAKEYSNIPTLVNYIGFSRGLGQELISTIVSYVNPTNVVQLKNPEGKYNFRKDLTTENVKADAKWMPDSTETEPITLSFELTEFITRHNSNKLNSLIYTPGQFRNIAIVAYFSVILKGDPLCLTDAGVRIYSAPLDKLKIQDGFGNSHPAICNANLVSLCRKVSVENKDVFKCLGWGVVRCVSITRNTIYLLTPLDLHLLDQIEYLVLSSVRLPLAMYITTAKDVVGQIPYIEGGQQTDLEKPSKRQHYNHEMANQ